MAEKRFRLQTESGEDVLGGEVGLGNAYVSAYGRLRRGDKPPSELEVDESCRKTYSLSGQGATTYVIVRTA